MFTTYYFFFFPEMGDVVVVTTVPQLDEGQLMGGLQPLAGGF